jgi:rhodanese-related sulfurtransferase
MKERRWSFVKAKEAIAIYEKMTGFKYIQEQEEEEKPENSIDAHHGASHHTPTEHGKHTSSATTHSPDYLQPKPVFIDLRHPETRKYIALEGFTSIPYSSLKQYINEGNLPKTTPIYLLCLAGYRSEKAANMLVEAGFSQVYVIEGIFSLFTHSLTHSLTLSTST